jgi:hypothetical protein
MDNRYDFCLRNLASEAEFYAEIKAPSRREAVAKVWLKFPAPVYTVLGYFSRDKYISPSGNNYKRYIDSPAKEGIFVKLCLHESRCLDRSPLQCIAEIQAVLNLDRDLKGIPGRVIVHGQSNSQNN